MTHATTIRKVDGEVAGPLLDNLLQSLEDGTYTVTIKKASRRRSNDQNEWLWGVIYPAVLAGLRDQGWEITDVEQVHELCKAHFASQDVVNPHTGEVVTLPSSTAKMSVTDFSVYVDKIRAFAADYLNISIPDPNEKQT